MEIVLIWLFFAFVCAICAGYKGRTGGGWFVLGLLFGPFALLIIILLPAVETIPGAGRAQDDHKICPFCAERIRCAAIRCRFCGADLADAPAPEAVISEQMAERLARRKKPPL